jgi:hypothetical protein
MEPELGANLARFSLLTGKPEYSAFEGALKAGARGFVPTACRDRCSEGRGDDEKVNGRFSKSAASWSGSVALPVEDAALLPGW